MRIVVTGAGGGLGRAFLDQLPAGHDAIPLTRADLDVTDFAAAVERIVPARPDVVMHFAAMTSVDGCQRDPRRAGLVNVLGSFTAAYAAGRAGALIVLISTDYVFDGRKEGRYDEDDVPHPVSVYGASKLEGERVARAVAPEHLVVRTSWVFGGGDDFVSTAVRRLAAGQEVGGIVDQTGTPTYVRHLGAALLPLVESGARGVVHLAGPEATTWYDVLVRAKRLGGLPGEVVEQKAGDLDRPAPRPANSPLTSRALKALRVPPLPRLDEGLREVVEEVTGVRA